MTWDVVIFDCDGVLVDTEPMTDAVISANLTRHGLQVAPADVHRLFVGATMDSLMGEARRLGADLPDDWADEIYGEVFAVLDGGAPVMPGLMSLLDALDAAGVATAVASNGPPEKMRRSLGPSGLWERFDGRIYSAHSHAPGKPDPHMIHLAMDRFGPRAAFIDDTAKGAEAGVRAGILTLGLGPGPFPQGVRQIAGLDEVRGVLGL